MRTKLLPFNSIYLLFCIGIKVGITYVTCRCMQAILNTNGHDQEYTLQRYYTIAGILSWRVCHMDPSYRTRLATQVMLDIKTQMEWYTLVALRCLFYLIQNIKGIIIKDLANLLLNEFLPFLVFILAVQLIYFLEVLGTCIPNLYLTALCLSCDLKIHAHLMNFFRLLLNFLGHFHTGRGAGIFVCPYYATLINSKSFISANGSHIFLLISHKIWGSQDLPWFLWPRISLKVHRFFPSSSSSLITLTI